MTLDERLAELRRVVATFTGAERARAFGQLEERLRHPPCEDDEPQLPCTRGGLQRRVPCP